MATLDPPGPVLPAISPGVPSECLSFDQCRRSRDVRRRRVCRRHGRHRRRRGGDARGRDARGRDARGRSRGRSREDPRPGRTRSEDGNVAPRTRDTQAHRTVPTVENGTQTPRASRTAPKPPTLRSLRPPIPISARRARAATESRVLFTAVRLERERRELRDRVALLTQREEALARREAGVRAARGEAAEAIPFAPTWKNSARVAPVWRIRRWRWIAPRRRRISSALRAACAATEARAAKREAEIRRLEEDAATARDDAARTREDAKIASAELRETQAATARAEARREAAERRAERRVSRRRRRGERRNAPGRWPREI